jgi:hypothetical protein
MAQRYDAASHSKDGSFTVSAILLFPGGVGKTTMPENFTSLGAEHPKLNEWRARGW